MQRADDDQTDQLSGQVCWLWWAALSPEARQDLAQAMVAESDQPLEAAIS